MGHINSTKEEIIKQGREPVGLGGGGGGASDIRVGGISLNNRVIVAGGGGGAGPYSVTSFGGNGGGLSGGSGVGGVYSMGDSATGGTQFTGFGLGLGGNSVSSMTAYVGSAGGGGGGYWGGNVAQSPAGCDVGGGGGSSYIGGVTNGTTTSGIQTGNGLVIISYSIQNTSGCTNPLASNYDSLAVCDDGPCIYCDLTTSIIIMNATGPSACDGFVFVNATRNYCCHTC